MGSASISSVFVFTFIPVPLSSMSFSFVSSTVSPFLFPPLSRRRHKMTHKADVSCRQFLTQSVIIIPLFCFSEKINLDISCKSTVWQMMADDLHEM